MIAWLLWYSVVQRHYHLSVISIAGFIVLFKADTKRLFILYQCLWFEVLFISRLFSNLCDLVWCAGSVLVIMVLNRQHCSVTGCEWRSGLRGGNIALWMHMINCHSDVCVAGPSSELDIQTTSAVGEETRDSTEVVFVMETQTNISSIAVNLPSVNDEVSVLNRCRTCSSTFATAHGLKCHATRRYGDANLNRSSNSLQDEMLWKSSRRTKARIRAGESEVRRL